MTEANWNHLIDVVAQVVEFLVAPIILAVLTWIGIWVKHKMDQKTAAVLAIKTEAVFKENVATNAEIKAEVAEIKQQTNGLLAAVVQAAGDKGFEAGVKSETDKK